MIDYWKIRKSEIDFYIHEFRYYQDIIERRIGQENIDFENFATDYKEQELSKDTINFYKNELANFFRKSFFVQIIAMIENQLRTICELIEKYNFQKFSINDLKENSDFEKAKNYLKKTIEIDFNLLNPEWTFIQRCQGLRNIIIHHQGSFSEKDKSDLKEFITKKSSLGSTPHYIDPRKKKFYLYFEIIDESFNIEFIEITASFFDKLFKYLYKINRKTSGNK